MNFKNYLKIHSKKSSQKELIIGNLIKHKKCLPISFLLMWDHINALNMMDVMVKHLASLEYFLMKIYNNILMFKKDIFSHIILILLNFMNPSFKHPHLGKNMIQ